MNQKYTPSIPKIVILGRPNVGKSTLFNRLVGNRRALVHNQPGVTRDRVEVETHWLNGGENFSVCLIDTGGLGHEQFDAEIKAQVQIALSEASVILLVVDGQAGLTLADEEIVKLFKKQIFRTENLIAGLDCEIPIILLVNKVDDSIHESFVYDFFSLGIEPCLPVSAEHGRGIEDLKSHAISLISKKALRFQHTLSSLPQKTTRIAIVGRPNVGKSTLVNALLKEERMITSPAAGTTTDVVDSQVILEGIPYTLLDTAGIRRKSKTKKGIEVLSVVLTKKALERCDVALLVLDGLEGITEQDEKIGALIENAGCSVILAVNKWDTQKDKKYFGKKDAADIIRKEIPFLHYAPLLFLSALEKSGYKTLGSLVEKILKERQQKIQTHELTEFIRQTILIHNPKNAKIYYCHQAGRSPPTFICHVNDPEKLPFNLRGHLQNAIRERWGFMGTPIKILYRKGSGGNRSISKNATK